MSVGLGNSAVPTKVHGEPGCGARQTHSRHLEQGQGQVQEESKVGPSEFQPYHKDNLMHSYNVKEFGFHNSPRKPAITGFYKQKSELV